MFKRETKTMNKNIKLLILFILVNGIMSNNITYESVEEVNCNYPEPLRNLRSCIGNKEEGFHPRNYQWFGDKLRLYHPGPDNGTTCKKGFSCGTFATTNCSCLCDICIINSGDPLLEEKPYVEFFVDKGLNAECHVNSYGLSPL